MDSLTGGRRSFTIPTEAILRVALWCALLVVLSFTSADPDLWGHIRFGMDILRDGNVHHIDTYSFASDRPWVNHEWGAEVVAALAFRIAGNAGLVVLKLLIIGPMLLLLDTELRKQGVRSAFLRDVAAGAAIIVTLSQAHHVRPQLFSLLLFSILLSSLLNAQRGSFRYLYVLPPMFAAWANLHGGWIVGGGVIALWTFILLIRNEQKLAFSCLAAGAVSLLATLATPYGPALWQFLRETIGFSRPEILEWQPVYVTGLPFVVLWAMALTIMLGGAYFERRGNNLRLERLAVGAALAVASFKVARLLAFFGLASVFLFAPAIARAYEERRAVRDRLPSRVLRFGFLAIGCAVGFFAMGVVRANFQQLRLDTVSMPDPQAVTVLAQQPTGNRVLVWFNWGEYAIWHLPPRMQVSIDGRRETVYSDRLQRRHFDFFFDRPGGATLPDDLAVDYIWIPRVLPAAHRLHADSRWTTIYEGEQSVIFSHAGSGSNRAPRIAAATTIPRFFPGP